MNLWRRACIVFAGVPTTASTASVPTLTLATRWRAGACASQATEASSASRSATEDGTAPTARDSATARTEARVTHSLVCPSQFDWGVLGRQMTFAERESWVNGRFLKRALSSSPFHPSLGLMRGWCYDFCVFSQVPRSHSSGFFFGRFSRGYLL